MEHEVNDLNVSRGRSSSGSLIDAWAFCGYAWWSGFFGLYVPNLILPGLIPEPLQPYLWVAVLFGPLFSGVLFVSHRITAMIAYAIGIIEATIGPIWLWSVLTIPSLRVRPVRTVRTGPGTRVPEVDFPIAFLLAIVGVILALYFNRKSFNLFMGASGQGRIDKQIL